MIPLAPGSYPCLLLTLEKGALFWIPILPSKAGQLTLQCLLASPSGLYLTLILFAFLLRVQEMINYQMDE